MASGGTFKNNFFRGYGLELDWRIVSQDASNNTSRVEAKLYLCSYGPSYTIRSTANKTGSMRIGPNTSSIFVNNAALNGNQRRHIYTYTADVTHNDDGNLSIIISGTFNIEVTLSGVWWSSVTVGGTAVLNRINRGRAFVKAGGTWRSGQVHVRAGGTWRRAIGVFVRSGGTWRRSRA